MYGTAATYNDTAPHKLLPNTEIIMLQPTRTESCQYRWAFCWLWMFLKQLGGTLSTLQRSQLAAPLTFSDFLNFLTSGSISATDFHYWSNKVRSTNEWPNKFACTPCGFICFKCYSCLLYNFTRLHSCDWFAWLHCTKHVAFLCVTFNNSFSQHWHNRNTHQVTGRLQPSWHTPAWMVSDSQLCLQANITHWKLDLLHEASINFG